uniref:Prefoldin subunit 1 n=1 Tax=Felis catus TaxID=9685 RepID=A0ABI7ZXC6_FELCA
MAAPVDLELKKAFTELQAKVIDTQQKVKLADIQIEQLNRTKKHAHLTDTEIMTLIDETNMYEGVGRMFILQSKEVIHNQLLEKQKIAEEKIKELESFVHSTNTSRSTHCDPAPAVPGTTDIMRETEHEQGRSRERGRHRIQNRLQALSCQHRARRGARTHRPDREIMT